ncbi:MAG: class I SAM-dependent methyltransferase [Neisseriales bacterium]|nr:MAG: class I SAM-dependent methyltransferase [Neisseriales bacterium]
MKTQQVLGRHSAPFISDNRLPDCRAMSRFYQWIYDNPKQARRLDRIWIIKLLLFFQDQRLICWYLNQIEQGSKVWQVANVYGDLICQVARKIGQKGIFHLTDISATQIRRSKNKLNKYPWSSTMHTDATQFSGNPPYDLICSFFLLHEIPDQKKQELIDNMLNKLSADGKAIFIDYHKPALWHPVRYILMCINRFLEPFSYALWQHEIKDFASCADAFTWTKHTMFGGVYQCVVAQPIYHHIEKLVSNH